MQLCVDKFISWGKSIACVTVVVVVFNSAGYGQPHAVFGGFISISGGLMLLCTELVIASWLRIVPA